MARDKVERVHRGEVLRGKRGAARPFCTIPATLFATRRVRTLSGSAVRLLWLEACWTPMHGAALPQRHVAKALHMRCSIVRDAMRALSRGDLIRLRKAAIRPGGMGSGRRGASAVYDLPHRIKGGHIRFQPGDRHLQGFVKLWSDDLRKLAANLSGPAARVLLIAAATPRTKHGTLQMPDMQIALSGDRLAELLPGLSARTANRAVAQLLDWDLIKEIRPRSGRRAALYAPHGLLTKGIPRGRQPSRRHEATVAARAMPAWSVQGGADLARKPSACDAKPRNSREPKEQGTEFRAKWDHANRGFAPSGTTEENQRTRWRTAAQSPISLVAETGARGPGILPSLPGGPDALAIAKAACSPAVAR